MLEGKGFCWFVRRTCNIAIAYCVSSSLDEMRSKMVASSEASSRREIIKQLLGYAFNAFLRLHCTIEELAEWSKRTKLTKVMEVDTFLRAFQDLKRDKTDSGLFEEIDLDSGTDDALVQKLSLLQAAVQKCKAIFGKHKKRKIDYDDKEGISSPMKEGASKKKTSNIAI